jgi:hypothetical protein
MNAIHIFNESPVGLAVGATPGKIHFGFGRAWAMTQVAAA